MKELNLALLLAFALALTGCLQHTYVVGDGAANGEIVYKHWHHHWLFGLIRPEIQEQLDVEALCPSGNAEIHQRKSFANGLVDALTSFIYTPTTVTVRCAGGEERGMASVELSETEARKIAASPRFREVVAEVAPERLEELEALNGR